MVFGATSAGRIGRPVSFPDWRAELAASRISPAQRWRFATEISRFLRYCEVLASPVTKRRAREYLAHVPLVSARPLARVALHWYFEAAHRTEHHDHCAKPHSHRPRRGDAQRSLAGDDGQDDAIDPRVECFSSCKTVPPDAAPPAGGSGGRIR